MTLRIPNTFMEVDNRKLAALLTPALLTQATDDGPQTRTARIGTSWLVWSEAHKHTLEPVVKEPRPD
jgi:hypothetical protein